MKKSKIEKPTFISCRVYKTSGKKYKNIIQNRETNIYKLISGAQIFPVKSIKITKYMKSKKKDISSIIIFQQFKHVQCR